MIWGWKQLADWQANDEYNGGGGNREWCGERCEGQTNDLKSMMVKQRKGVYEDTKS